MATLADIPAEQIAVYFYEGGRRKRGRRRLEDSSVVAYYTLTYYDYSEYSDSTNSLSEISDSDIDTAVADAAADEGASSTFSSFSTQSYAPVGGTVMEDDAWSYGDDGDDYGGDDYGYGYEGCDDSTTWYKSGSPDKDCAYLWTQNNIDAKCYSWENDDGQQAYLACYDACGTCYLASDSTESPTSTPAPSGQCATATINMYDAYGDGWNGGEITIYSEEGTDSSTSVATATFYDGKTGTQAMCLPEGCYTVTPTEEGTYPSEITWDIAGVVSGDIYDEVTFSVVDSGGLALSASGCSFTASPTITPKPSLSPVPTAVPTSCSVFQFLMFDQYGDGWNGAYFQMKSGSTTLAEFSLDSDETILGTGATLTSSLPDAWETRDSQTFGVCRSYNTQVKNNVGRATSKMACWDSCLMLLNPLEIEAAITSWNINYFSSRTCEWIETEGGSSWCDSESSDGVEGWDACPTACGICVPDTLYIDVGFSEIAYTDAEDNEDVFIAAMADVADLPEDQVEVYLYSYDRRRGRRLGDAEDGAADRRRLTDTVYASFTLNLWDDSEISNTQSSLSGVNADVIIDAINDAASDYGVEDVFDSISVDSFSVVGGTVFSDDWSYDDYNYGSSECRAYSDCGCSDGEFCNFDYGTYGSCESCDSHSDDSSCYSDGLPSDGEEDCVACCFSDTSYGGDDYPMDDYPTDDYSNDDYHQDDYSNDDYHQDDYSNDDYHQDDYSNDDYHMDDYSNDDYHMDDYSMGDDYNDGTWDDLPGVREKVEALTSKRGGATGNGTAEARRLQYWNNYAYGYYGEPEYNSEGVFVSGDVCLFSGCIDVEIDEGDNPDEISWLFNHNVESSGGAPFQAEILISGSTVQLSCETQPPTTLAPTEGSAAPTMTPAPTFAPTTAVPTISNAPTALFASVTSYAELSDEMSAIAGGAGRPITIGADFTTTAAITFSGSSAVGQIYGLDYTVTASSHTHGMFIVAQQADLEISDVTFVGGLINAGEDANVDGIENACRAESTASVLSGNAIYITDGATVTLERVTMRWFGAQYGGGVYVTSDATIFAYETTFNLCCAHYKGGGLFVTNGHFYLHNSTFSEGYVKDDGDGSAVMIDGADGYLAEIRYTTFDGNRGGTTVKMEEVDLQLYDTTVTNSVANGDGNTEFLSCEDGGQLVLARIFMVDTDLINIGDACIAFLYHANDGDDQDILTTASAASGSLSVTRYYYTYPCPAGKYSEDGLEHTDAINANDPTCSSNVAKCNDACEVCVAGRYLGEDESHLTHMGILACDACPVGTANGDWGDVTAHDSVFDCESCAAGSYVDTTGATECIDCVDGTYSADIESLYCSVCLPGTAANGTRQTACVDCAAGYFSLGSVAFCTACPTGTYQPDTAQAICLNSPAGFSNNETGAAAPAAFSGAQSCTIAAPGQYVAAAGAKATTACAAGTISGSGASACTNCKLGSYVALTGQESCTNADAGSYVAALGASAQTACAVGKISGSAASECEDCAPGSFAAATGMTSCTLVTAGSFVAVDGASAETPCPAGKYSGSAASDGQSACTDCERGYYAPSAASTSCQLVNGGSYVAAEGASEQLACPAGTYSSTGASACVDCAIGTYSPNAGTSSCSTSLAGTYVDFLGASEGVCCPAGKYSGAGATACTNCEAGSYGTEACATSCTLVTAGTFVTEEGQSEATACPAGKYAGTGATECADCAIGTYSPNAASDSCWTAAAGSYVGLAGQSEATACPAGTFSGAGQSECDDCPAGRYYAETGGTGCTLTTAGYYAATPGLTEQAACAVGTYSATAASECTGCEAGKYNAETGQSGCTSANPGEYVGAAGASAGTACPVGTYSGSGQTECTPCAAGTYVATEGNTACVLADGGTYVPAGGATAGTPCPSGKYSGSGQTECTDCLAGSYTDDSVLTKTSCNTADAGTYVDAAGATAATPCPAGTYSGSGQTVCTDCAVGTYASATGSLACSLSSAGAYVDATGASGDTACAPGSYSGTAASACSPCTPGKYATESGKSSCDTTDAGSYVDFDGATAGVPCPTGRYSGSGQSECTACGATTFAAANGGSGASFCQICATGTTSKDASATCVTSDAGYIAPSAEVYGLEIASSLVFDGVDVDLFNSDPASQAAYADALAELLASDPFSELVDSVAIGTVGPAVALGRRRAHVRGLLATATATIPFTVRANYSASAAENVSDVVPYILDDFTDDIKLDTYSGDLQAAVAAAGAPALADASVDEDETLEAVDETELPTYELVSAASFDGQSQCPAGTYSLSGASYCITCDPGSYTAIDGQTSCLFSDAGSYVATSGATAQSTCAAGTYTAGSGARDCSLCAAGTFQASAGMTSCGLSNAGSYVPTTGATAETPCAPGKFSGSGASECTQCSPGFYTGETGQSACSLTDAGKYVDVAGSSTQTPCPPGTYSGSGASACSDCAAGTYSDNDAGAASCTTVSAGGYVGVAGASAQTPCAPGKFSGSGASECTRCSPGFYTGETGQSACSLADAGKYVDVAGSSTQTPCPPGTYSGSGASACSDCAAGTYSDNDAGAASCTTVSAGGYVGVAGASAQTPCPAGHYSGSAATACDACAVGTYAAGEGSASCSLVAGGGYVGAEGASAQTACPAGTYSGSGATACEPCGLASFAGAEGSTSCTLSDAGYHVASAGQSAADPCPAGYYSGSGASACAACEVGRYADADAQSACGLSDGGYYVPLEGSTEPFPCASGRYSGSGASFCQICGPGTTSDEGSAACTTSDAGSIAPSAEIYVITLASALNVDGASSADADDVKAALLAAFGGDNAFSDRVVLDPVDTIRVADVGPMDGASIPFSLAANYSATADEDMEEVKALVSLDFYDATLDAAGDLEAAFAGSLAGATVESVDDPEPSYELWGEESFSGTALCPAGKYSLSGASVCVWCDPGSYTSTSGMSTCLFSDAGSYVSYTGATGQLACPAGRYTAGSGAHSCELCASGTFNDADGSTSCSLANAGSYVTRPGQTAEDACEAGRYSGSGATVCSNCPLGFYAADEGVAACTLAEAGSYVGETGSTATTPCALGLYSGSGASACSACDPGKYADELGTSSCSISDAGTYVADEGATGGVDCPAGTYSGSGQTVCTDCARGTYASTEGNTACSTADGGTYVDELGASAATPCPVGRYSGSGQTTCTKCTKGTYQDAEGTTTCSLTDAGYYVDYHGASAQDACPAGKYSSMGQAACTKCQEGRYNANAGQSECGLTNGGYFVSVTGATAEVECSAGRYSGSGQARCDLCESGTTSDAGAASCYTTAAGTVAAPNEVYGIELESSLTLGNVTADEVNGDASTQSDLLTVLETTFAGDDSFSDLVDSAEISGLGEATDSTADDDARRLDEGYVYTTLPFTLSTNYTAASGENLTSATDLITSQLVDAITAAVEDGTLAANIRRYANATLGALGAGVDGDRSIDGASRSRSNGWNKPAQTECKKADQGYYVPVSGATNQTECPVGTYSATEYAACIDCSPRQCADCCVNCDDQQEEGLDCDYPGMTIEGLEVERGWWRTNKFADQAYICQLSGACKGGNDTDTQCKEGHYGVKCGLCEDNWMYDSVVNRCVECASPAIDITGSPGKLIGAAMIFAVLSAVAVWYARKYCSRKQIGKLQDLIIMRLIKGAEDAMDDGIDDAADGAGDVAAEVEGDAADVAEVDADVDEDVHADGGGGGHGGGDGGTNYAKYITKIKIVMGLYQIIGSMTWQLPQIPFPDIMQAPISFSNYFSFDVFSVIPLECYGSVSFFNSMVMTTTLPFIVAALIVAYVGLRFLCVTDPDKRKHLKNSASYALLLLSFCVLPGCSSVCFQYFGCSEYEMGATYNGKARAMLSVLNADPNIRCNEPRYDSWRLYVLLMIFIYPIGTPLGYWALLRSKRHMIDPLLEDDGNQVDEDDLFAKAREDFELVMQQEHKLVIRQVEYADEIAVCAFLIEEYEPRCWWFSVYEVCRRLILTGGLTIFKAGGATQVAIGMLVAMISYRVYVGYAPFIDDDDDAISEVCQTQLVIVFFGALMLTVQNMVPEDEQESGFAQNLFGIVLTMVFFAGMFVAAYYVFLEACGRNVSKHFAPYMWENPAYVKSRNSVFGDPDDPNIKRHARPEITGKLTADDFKFAVGFRQQGKVEKDAEAELLEAMSPEERETYQAMGDDEKRAYVALEPEERETFQAMGDDERRAYVALKSAADDDDAPPEKKRPDAWSDAPPAADDEEKTDEAGGLDAFLCTQLGAAPDGPPRANCLSITFADEQEADDDVALCCGVGDRSAAKIAAEDAARAPPDDDGPPPLVAIPADETADPNAPHAEVRLANSSYGDSLCGNACGDAGDAPYAPSSPPAAAASA
ncbi:hypothetical protein JL722_2476 [Aureococcus anophagefferens]|nr:hypothetical protein JL722_2476 [Aureococcus anophagefferens]